MLTDYHVHLRPDEDDTPPERYFTDANVDSLPGRRRRRRDRRARHRRAHPPLRAGARDLAASVLGRAGDRRPRRLLRVPRRRSGLQGRDRGRLRRRRRGADREPARRPAASTTSSARSTSSARRAVDQDRWDVWEAEGHDPDRVWSRYFERARRRRVVGALRHRSPIPTWSRSGGRRGRARSATRARYYEPAVEAIAEAGVAVEVSTAGLRKPVGEIYPAAGFAELCVEAGVPFTLSSDAHVPERGRLRLRGGRRAS